MMRLNNRAPAAKDRTGAQTTEAVRALLLRGKIPELRGCFEDLSFLFAWTAAVMQMLLLFDPRYREFPLSTFAVPLLVTAGRLLIGDLPRHNGGREELVVGLALVVGAVGSAIQEGPLNTQSLTWNAAALLLAAGPLLRFTQGRQRFFFEKKN